MKTEGYRWKRLCLPMEYILNLERRLNDCPGAAKVFTYFRHRKGLR